MWFLFALSASIFNATYKLSNQYLKLSGHKLTVLIKVFQIAVFIPFLFFIDWPQYVLFYCLALATGPLVLLQDRAIFNFISKYDAGPITRVEPLSVPFVFVAWLILKPAEYYNLIENSFIALGIILSISSCIYFSFRMRKCALSFQILKSMLPLILLMGSISILAKYAIDYAPNIEGIIVYAFIQSLSLVLLSPLFAKKADISQIEAPLKKYLFSAFGLSLVITSVIILRLYGFIYASNPAYVTAVMLIAPFWIMMFYKIKKYKEKTDVLSGIGIVLSVIVMSIFVSIK
jgi:hypothetical protein